MWVVLCRYNCHIPSYDHISLSDPAGLTECEWSYMGYSSGFLIVSLPTALILLLWQRVSDFMLLGSAMFHLKILSPTLILMASQLVSDSISAPIVALLIVHFYTMIWLICLKLKGGKCLAVFSYSFITYPDVIGLTGCEWCHIRCTYLFSWIFLWPWSFCLDRMWVMLYLIQLCPLTFLTFHLNLLIVQGVRNSMPDSDISFLIPLIPMFDLDLTESKWFHVGFGLSYFTILAFTLALLAW